MKKLRYAVFCVIRYLVKLFYPKTEVVGAQDLADEAYIIAANHTQMNGPIIAELYYPRKSVTWCAGEMMKLKEVPNYAYKDFWSRKPKYIKWFYKLLSYIIAPLSVCVFNCARTIAVYHDKRAISAYRDTVKMLSEGYDVIIFPEHDMPYNHIVCDFQEGFVDVAKIYYKRTGKAVKFVPLYIAPTLCKAYLGEPIAFNPEIDIKDERKRICEYLMREITKIALELPEHLVVPYNNLPKKAYVFNKKGLK